MSIYQETRFFKENKSFHTGWACKTDKTPSTGDRILFLGDLIWTFEEYKRIVNPEAFTDGDCYCFAPILKMISWFPEKKGEYAIRGSLGINNAHISSNFQAKIPGQNPKIGLRMARWRYSWAIPFQQSTNAE